MFDYSKFTAAQLRLELDIRRKGSPLWNYAMKELEKRIEEDILRNLAAEPVIVELLNDLAGKE